VLALERLRASTQAFQPQARGRRQRALPRFIGRLAVITSPTGAAVRDVLSVLARRFPLLEVEVLPVAVQGQEAASAIRAMLERAGSSGRYQALLLTRGGGSLEDLWAFNDEALARAIAASPVPVLSAVGHEIDFSLADFAADLRAPTPSAAAELLVPERGELLAHLAQLRRRLDAVRQRQQSALAQRSDQAWLQLQALRPQLRLERGQHRLQGLHARLQGALAATTSLRLERLRRCAQALERQHPRQRLAAQRHRGQMLEQRLQSSLHRRLGQAGLQLQGLARALHSLSPFGTLARGYAIVRDPVSGRVLRRARDARPGQALDAQLEEGVLRVIAGEPLA
jgi:exodeoxyribonuclease VII large subunit